MLSRDTVKNTNDQYLNLHSISDPPPKKKNISSVFI